MSRAQEPHRAFFPFGNPFRNILPKSSVPNTKLLELLKTFEGTLAERLEKLKPNDGPESLSLSWACLAMEALCATHRDIKTFITELELPVCDWDDKWIDMYLDVSVKLLDICITFSSELSRLNQGHLLLQCVLHSLDSASSKQLLRSNSSIHSWRQHVNSKNPKVLSCFTILDDLIASVNLPKVKNSGKGKVLMHAMYGVKVLTVFICGVFLAAFSGSSRALTNLQIPDTFFWAGAFADMQTTINGKIRSLFSAQKDKILEEHEVVHANVEKLHSVIQDEMISVESEEFEKHILQLGNDAQRLSQGLENLAKKVEDFFQIVLTGRDALLCNLRGSEPLSGHLL